MIKNMKFKDRTNKTERKDDIKYRIEKKSIIRK